MGFLNATVLVDVDAQMTVESVSGVITVLHTNHR